MKKIRQKENEFEGKAYFELIHDFCMINNILFILRGDNEELVKEMLTYFCKEKGGKM